MTALYEYFRKWDPIGLISGGFPEDEYDDEAFEIQFKYIITMSVDQVANLVYKTFVERLGVDPEEFKRECYLRAPEIKSIIDSFN